MKKDKTLLEKEWIQRHKSDIQNIHNIMNDLEKDKKVQKVYKKFIKTKK